MLTLTIDDVAAQSFAERLEEVMRERGITAAALATAIGVSPAAISLLLSLDSKSMRPENLFQPSPRRGSEKSINGEERWELFSRILSSFEIEP